MDGSSSAAPAWQALVLLLVSILGRAIMNRFSQLQQTHAGYFMTANKRLHMGDKLKRIPMGYFNDQSLGELTGIATTVLDEVESAGPWYWSPFWAGLSTPAVMLLCVLFWDWRIGLLALAGMALYLLLLSRMEKQSAKIAPKRQRDEARLVEAVLEQLQGMSVIKSFNLTGKGDKRDSPGPGGQPGEQSGSGKVVHSLHLGPGDGPPPVQRADSGSCRVAVPERQSNPG